jgi:hypothetical protein
MIEQVSIAGQMFLIPASILFIALAVARTEGLKALVSVLALGISLLWLVRVWTWKEISFGDRSTALGLAVIFVVATALCVFVHGRACAREGGLRRRFGIHFG